MFHISRWKHPTIASKLSALALALLPVSSLADAKTITAVMHSDLRVIDPGMMTTAYITRDHRLHGL